MDYKWLISYEKSRHKEPKIPNESWANSKYNIGDWRTSQKVFIKSLGLTVGQSWWKLRRLWKKYKVAGREGGYRDDIAYQINRLAVSLDIGRVDLPETADMPDYEFEDQPNNQKSAEEVPGEDPLYKILRRQEAEAAREQKAEDSSEEFDWWQDD